MPTKPKPISGKKQLTHILTPHLFRLSKNDPDKLIEHAGLGESKNKYSKIINEMITAVEECVAGYKCVKYIENSQARPSQVRATLMKLRNEANVLLDSINDIDLSTQGQFTGSTILLEPSISSVSSSKGPLNGGWSTGSVTTSRKPLPGSLQSQLRHFIKICDKPPKFEKINDKKKSRNKWQISRGRSEIYSTPAILQRLSKIFDKYQRWTADQNLSRSERQIVIKRKNCFIREALRSADIKVPRKYLEPKRFTYNSE